MSATHEAVRPARAQGTPSRMEGGYVCAAAPARRLTTRLLMEIQEATDAASCAANRGRRDTHFSSLTFAWNGAGYHGYVRDPVHGWITFAHAGHLSQGAITP